MLEEIIQKTRMEVELRKSKITPDLFKLGGETRSLKAAILSAKERRLNPVITEIKPASPSEGKLRDVNVPLLASAMERGGACAISVLTEPFYFYGSLDNLKKAKEAVKIPVMRKDFIVDEYQLLEAKHYGADAVLLMVSILGEDTAEFYKRTRKLGMEALVEVHTEEELEHAVNSGAEIIGVNNRNLKDLKIDLNTTKKIAPGIPKNRIKVSESGVKTRADLDFVLKYADAALVGTSLMRSSSVEETVRTFANK